MFFTELSAIGLVAFGLCSGQMVKPHRVVIEVNIPGATTYRSVLGNVESLGRAFKPERVQIEVVCLGEGIRMLFSKGNPLAGRISKAETSGVSFAACGNTVRAMHLSKSDLLPQVQIVDSGVAELVRKQESGWAYLKGG